jgi:hypothetical protein
MSPGVIATTSVLSVKPSSRICLSLKAVTCDTDVLETLLALLRGDDDLLETARGLRGRGTGQRGGYGDEEDGGQLVFSCHGSVPPGPA